MAEQNKQIFFWHGENDYEIFQQVAAWTEVFEKKYSGLNVSSFDLGTPGSRDQIYKDLKNALQVNSLFGSNKLIILKNFITPKLDKEWQTLIIETLGKLTDGFFLIFVQKDKPDARGKLYKEIQKLVKKGGAESKEYKLPQGAALVNWIQKKAKQEKANFNPGAIELLVASVGNDLWQMDIEIQKLSNYKNGAEITKEDVDLLVKGKYNDDIFQLMDAISVKDKKKALKLFRDQIDSGANEIYLLTMLIRQFRIFWQMKEYVQEHGPAPDPIARELKIHPFVVRKTLSQLDKFKLAEIKFIYNDLLDFEIKMKTSKTNFDLLFGLLIAKLQ